MHSFFGCKYIVNDNRWETSQLHSVTDSPYDIQTWRRGWTVEHVTTVQGQKVKDQGHKVK